MTKCSSKNLKQTSRGREHPFRHEKYEKEAIKKSKIKKSF